MNDTWIISFFIDNVTDGKALLYSIGSNIEILVPEAALPDYAKLQGVKGTLTRAQIDEWHDTIGKPVHLDTLPLENMEPAVDEDIARMTLDEILDELGRVFSDDD